jgi:hypothetical protein
VDAAHWSALSPFAICPSFYSSAPGPGAGLPDHRRMGEAACRCAGLRTRAAPQHRGSVVEIVRLPGCPRKRRLGTHHAGLRLRCRRKSCAWSKVGMVVKQIGTVHPAGCTLDSCCRTGRMLSVVHDRRARATCGRGAAPMAVVDGSPLLGLPAGFGIAGGSSVVPRPERVGAPAESSSNRLCQMVRLIVQSRPAKGRWGRRGHLRVAGGAATAV